MGNTSTEISPEDLQVGPSQSFIAIDPAIFGDKDQIINRFSEYLQNIRELPAIPGKTIYVHGDKEAIAYADRKKNGIEIDDHTLEEIMTIAQRLDVDYKPFIG